MHRETASPSLTWRGWAIVLLTLLAPWMQGSTLLPSQAVLFGLAGLILFFSPKPFLKWCSPVIWLCLAWVLLAATAFLPLSWFPQTSWRQVLTLDFGISLGDLYTPQPWLTLNSIFLFAASLFWGLFLLSQHWNSFQRRSLISIFCIGITLLAAACLTAHAMGWQEWVGGGGDARLGPFPSKNQSSHLFAIAGILSMGLLRESVYRQRKAAFFWWIPPLIILPCLFALQSRGGFAVFALGVFFLSFPRRWRGNDLAGSAILLSILLLGSAALILVGVPLMDRILGSIGTQKSEFRIGMYRDVFRMMEDLPWNGVGLGNFADIFALWRHETAVTFNRALHPDSDWSWMGAELGWITFIIAPLTLFAAIAPALGRKLHESTWVDRSIGLALLASFFFSFIEVSGHVLGTAWPLIFLISLAAQSSYHQSTGKGGRWIFPAGGLLLAGIGVLFFASTRGKVELPTPWQAVLFEKEGERFLSKGDLPTSLATLDKSLAIHPLDAHTYLVRAIVLASLREDEKARVDFSRARYLEPIYPYYPMAEGLVWQRTRPLRTVSAWSEALHRAEIEPAVRQQLFDQMLSSASEIPAIHSEMISWAMADPLLAFILFQRNAPPGFQGNMDLWRGHDPNLSQFSQKRRLDLIQLWFELGDISELEFFLSSNPKELNLFWPVQAKILARRGEYDEALALTRRFLKFPPQPPVSKEPLAQLQKDAANDPENILPGLRLLSRQVADGKFAEAVETLQRFKSNQNFPDYYYSLASEAYRQNQNMQKAWEMVQVLVEKQQPDPS